jgi:hypothetical protein
VKRKSQIPSIKSRISNNIKAQNIQLTAKVLNNSLSPGGRELERGGFHPHLNPLPSRERKFGAE